MLGIPNKKSEQILQYNKVRHFEMFADEKFRIRIRPSKSWALALLLEKCRVPEFRAKRRK